MKYLRLLYFYKTSKTFLKNVFIRWKKEQTNLLKDLKLDSLQKDTC